MKCRFNTIKAKNKLLCNPNCNNNFKKCYVMIYEISTSICLPTLKHFKAQADVDTDVKTEISIQQKLNSPLFITTDKKKFKKMCTWPEWRFGDFFHFIFQHFLYVCLVFFCSCFCVLVVLRV